MTLDALMHCWPALAYLAYAAALVAALHAAPAADNLAAAQDWYGEDREVRP